MKSEFNANKFISEHSRVSINMLIKFCRMSDVSSKHVTRNSREFSVKFPRMFFETFFRLLRQALATNVICLRSMKVKTEIWYFGIFRRNLHKTTKTFSSLSLIASQPKGNRNWRRWESDLLKWNFVNKRMKFDFVLFKFRWATDSRNISKESLMRDLWENLLCNKSNDFWRVGNSKLSEEDSLLPWWS